MYLSVYNATSLDCDKLVRGVIKIPILVAVKTFTSNNNENFAQHRNMLQILIGNRRTKLDLNVSFYLIDSIVLIRNFCWFFLLRHLNSSLDKRYILVEIRNSKNQLTHFSIKMLLI